jgi:hypothetical protein
LFVLTDPAVAFTVRGSPGKTAGAVALHASVIGGCFLHPVGARAKTTRPKSRERDFDVLKYIF